MKPYPSVHTFESLRQITQSCQSSRDGKHWFPARPMGFCSFGNRLRCAWLVFTGKADAFVWPNSQ